MKNNQLINGKEFDRNTGIGGSDATRIYEGDWHQLWSEKTGKNQYPDLSDVLPVQMGIHTEPFNIQWFEKQSEMKVKGEYRWTVLVRERPLRRCPSPSPSPNDSSWPS